MDLMQVKARMVQIMNGMKDGMKTGAEAGLRQQLPNPTPEQLAKADNLANVVFQDLPIDEMVDAMIPIYQRHLTKADLDSVNCFLLLACGTEAPERTAGDAAAAIKVGSDIMLKRIPDLTQRLNREVAQLAKEEAEKNSPAQTTK